MKVFISFDMEGVAGIVDCSCANEVGEDGSVPVCVDATSHGPSGCVWSSCCRTGVRSVGVGGWIIAR